MKRILYEEHERHNMTTCECCASAFVDYKRTGTKVCCACTDEAAGFRRNTDQEFAKLIQNALEYVTRATLPRQYRAL
jgi:hypothetical protein